MVFEWLKWYKKPEYRDIKEYATAVSSGNRSLSPDGRNKSSIPNQLRLDRVLANKTCSPVSLYDFYMYLKYIEFSTENLEFYVWFKNYEENYTSTKSISGSTMKDDSSSFGMLEKEPSIEYSHHTSDPEMATKTMNHISQLIGSAGLCCPGTKCDTSFHARLGSFARRNFKFSTLHPNPANASQQSIVSHSEERAELDAIITLFLTPDAEKELNIPPTMRDQALIALQTSTDPAHLRPIAEHVYQLIRNCSHRNFVRLAVGNGTYETLCVATGLGIVLTVAGFLTVLLRALVPHVRANPRWDVFAAWPMWWIGMSLIFAGLRGSCFFLLLFTRRQPLPWERVEAQGTVVRKQTPLQRFLARIMIFDRKFKVKDVHLRKLQHKIVVQSLIGGAVFACCSVVIFIFLPIWRV